jgi:hypothetical protein
LYTNKHGIGVRTDIDIEQDMNDVWWALLDPIRPYGFVTAFAGGSHWSVHGHYQYLEMDQSHVGGVINYLYSRDSGQSIFTMICGRMTHSQREIARSWTEINPGTYINILSWFIQKYGHSDYEKSSIPDKTPQPKLIEDRETTNNTDKPVNIGL